MRTRYVEFQSVDRASNRARVYRIVMPVQPELFGPWAIVLRWGRIGAPLREKRERFTSAAALEARLRELIARRLAHGYTVTAVSESKGGSHAKRNS